MTQSVQQLIDTFESLTESEKQQAASELLRRTLDLAPARLPDEALVEAAEQLFSELDAREAADAKP